MTPPASVSGLYFAHPAAHYFGVGKIERDQVEDYARRKTWDIKTAERWLGPLLNYEPREITSGPTQPSSPPTRPALSSVGQPRSRTSDGAVGIGAFDNGADVSVTFNSAGLSALTASEGGEFVVGGTLGAFTAPGVPESASWALMLLGVGSLGATLRSRRGSLSATA